MASGIEIEGALVVANFAGGKKDIDMRKIAQVLALILFVFFIVYYLFIVIDTHSIMRKIKSIEKGDIYYEKSNTDPLSVFCYHEGDLSKAVHFRRVYTWCWNEKGKIWITNDIVPWNGGTIEKSRDQHILEIEKIDGKWQVIKRIHQP